ncbi:MAG: hypothetical protein ABIP41_04310 [Croceibacterium sp.]
MLRNIIGALAGAKAAQRAGTVDGATGAVLGVVAVPLVTRIIQRMGPIGWIAAAAGGYAMNRYMEGKPADAPKRRPARRRSTAA